MQNNQLASCLWLIVLWPKEIVKSEFKVTNIYFVALSNRVRLLQGKIIFLRAKPADLVSIKMTMINSCKKLYNKGLLYMYYTQIFVLVNCLLKIAKGTCAFNMYNESNVT